MPLGTEVEVERKTEANCPLCRGAARYAFTTEDRLHPIPGQFDSYQCEGCRVLFLHPFPTPDVLNRHYPEEEYYAYRAEGTLSKAGLKNYFKNLALERRSWAGKFLRRLARLRGNEVWEIAASFPSGSAVLDIGCGNGDYLAIFQKFGIKCYGVEPSPKAAEIARQRGFRITEDAEKNFGGERFDVILLRHTLEHLPNPAKTLQSCLGLIKKTGRLVITVPSFSSISFFLFGSNYWGIDAPRHLYCFTVAGLRRLVEKSGWSMEKSWTVSTPVALAFSLEHWLSSHFPNRERFYPGQRLPKRWHKVLGVALALPLFALDRFKRGDNLTLVLRPK